METEEKKLAIMDLFLEIILLNISILISSIIFATSTPGNSFNLSLFLLHANFSYLITNIFSATKKLFISNHFSEKLYRISKQTLIFIAFSLLIDLLIIGFGLNKLFFLQYTILFYISQLVFCWIKSKWLKLSRRNHSIINHALIVGVNSTAHYLRKIMESNPSLRLKFIGFVNHTKQFDANVLGCVDDLSNLIDHHQIHIVFVTLSFSDKIFRGDDFLRICNKKGIRLRFIPENKSCNIISKSIAKAGKLVFINPQQIPMDDAKSRLLKRAFDIAFSSFVIVFLLSWIYPIVAILIKLSSKGPVLFIQKRTCLNNQIFNCLKFRSMCENDLADSQQATNYDSRITKLGAILRKTNIDELPQFINVLLGDMSISGPRPHMLKHTRIYSELIDYYQIRHHVKPGITGWAQVNGYRGETDELWKMEKRVEYDLDYIENWNFWWDIKIIALTVTNMKSLLPKMPESQRMTSYDCNGLQLHKLNE